MIIKLYRYAKNPLIVNKTLESITDVNGHFKDNTSFLNPTFVIKSKNTMNFNYVSINFGGKTYFYSIDNIEIEGDTQHLICSMDYLKSFENDIKNITGLVDRASKHNNLSSKNFYNFRMIDDEIVTTADTLTQSYSGQAMFTENDYKFYYLTTTN